jgi:hypothetical protein
MDSWTAGRDSILQTLEYEAAWGKYSTENFCVYEINGIYIQVF